MNTGTRLAGFAVVLAAALGTGAVAGGVVGPISVTEDDGGMGGMGGIGDAGAAPVAGGLAAMDAGYGFVPESTTLEEGRPFTFTIVGPDGEPVTDYEVDLDKELHLLVVSADLVTYRHVHPERDDEGTWSVRLDDLSPGAYRAVADVVPAGADDLALGINLYVPGELDPAPLPAPSPVAEVDGYEVVLDGDLQAGSSSVTLTVARDGEPVDDLEPYLGASGHLVAFRTDDLAYAHVHPEEESPGGGPSVPFVAELPSGGTYRLFFDFAHDGEVRNAAFTVEVPRGEATTTDDATTSEEGH